ncbi:iron-sulfur assembly protein IscA 2, mitochondrial [Trifolium repens]|nr:iron-sulfur assembly protein IscA 2, mitochondrial [Trifolium repens]
MQTSLFRRLAPSLAARFQRNESLISSFSSSSSVLHHVMSSSSSYADVEPVHITENCVRVFERQRENCGTVLHPRH